MVDLNAPVWRTLYSAGNDADKWLRSLLDENGDTRENIEILAEDLSHQLSYYSATAYVLPHLAAFCPKLSREDKVFLIAQTGPAIAAEASQPLSPNTESFQEFQEGLTALRHEAAQLVTAPDLWELLGGDPDLGQQFALSALSILGNRNHAYDIYLMSGSCWEEAAVACTCGWNNETISFEDLQDCLIPAEINAWDGTSLADEASWFHGLLEMAKDEQIKPVLPWIYGTGICPECQKQEPYWTWFERFMEDY